MPVKVQPGLWLGIRLEFRLGYRKPSGHNKTYPYSLHGWRFIRFPNTDPKEEKVENFTQGAS